MNSKVFINRQTRSEKELIWIYDYVFLRLLCNPLYLNNQWFHDVTVWPEILLVLLKRIYDTYLSFFDWTYAVFSHVPVTDLFWK